MSTKAVMLRAHVL